MIFNHALHRCCAFLRETIRGSSTSRVVRNQPFISRSSKYSISALLAEINLLDICGLSTSQ
jgi:hypothetical protein